MRSKSKNKFKAFLPMLMFQQVGGFSYHLEHSNTIRRFKLFFVAFVLLAGVLGFGESARAELINPATDLEYLGAFRLPNEYSNNHQWEYGGNALAFRPDGDSGGEEDGFPGSLYSVGRQQSFDEKKCVSEFSIPLPINSTNLGDLNTATTLQPFNDITNGFFDSTLDGLALNRVRGLAYLEAQPEQSSGKLYWSIWSRYNFAGPLPSHGYSDTNCSNPNAQGIWSPEDYLNQNSAGYLFDIPESWADAHVGGKRLASGMIREAGNPSRGPVIYAIAPYNYSNFNPPPSNVLPRTELIYYDEDHPYPNYVNLDHWHGGAWITMGDKEAVVIVGLKCIGSACYGSGEACGDPCDQYLGYHCYPRMPQMIFYDPDDLAEVANGTMNPWEVQPYQVLDLTTVIPQYGMCTQTEGATYDRDNGLLYIIQDHGDGAKSLVHVFNIDFGEDITPPSRSNPQPTGTLTSGTASTTISLDTDETATCKYSETPNTAYDDIFNTFSTTNSTSHSQNITGLSDGNSYTYYVRCEDTATPPNQNTDDFEISFNVATFCAESWTCTTYSDWSDCIDSQQTRTRTCTDENSCGTEITKPDEIETQACSQTYGISDFAQLVIEWLWTSLFTVDLNNDGIVNTRDLGIMMSNWEN